MHPVKKFNATHHSVSCDICMGPTLDSSGYNREYGTLSANWGYGSSHDGDRFEINFCEPCFFKALTAIQHQCSKPTTKSRWYEGVFGRVGNWLDELRHTKSS